MFDPIARARDYRQRRGGESVEARRSRQARQGLRDQNGGGSPREAENYIQTLEALPEAGLDQLGRMIYVRNDGAEDVLNVGIIDADGSPQWVGLSLESTEQAETAVYKWRTPTSGTGLLTITAKDAVVNASLNALYVTDDTRVVRFNATTGAYVSTFGSVGSGNGQFDQPWGIAVASSGDLYVVDRSNDRVQQFTSAGAYVRQFGTLGSGNGNLYRPQYVTLDGSGNVYVSDVLNKRVAVFSSTGTWQQNIGSAGTGNGQFSSPTGVSISGTELFVADDAQHRIQVFTASTGAYLQQFGTYGNSSGQYNLPSGIRHDSDGDLWIADTSNNRAVKVSSTGAVHLIFGVSGNKSGQIRNPYGIGVKGDDVYVVQSGRAQLFTVIPTGGVQVADGGVVKSARTQINFVNGNGITTTVADDATNQKADVTIAFTPTMQVATGGSTTGTGNLSATASTADCSGTGNTMVAGGCQATGGVTHLLRGSYPSSASQWTCTSNNSGTSNTLTAYVICRR